MNCENIKQMINKGAVLLDVRTEQEFLSGHIKGAINVAIEYIQDHYSEDDNIIVYCRSGARSGAVKRYYDSIGYNITDIGGITKFIGCIE